MVHPGGRALAAGAAVGLWRLGCVQAVWGCGVQAGWGVQRRLGLRCAGGLGLRCAGALGCVCRRLGVCSRLSGGKLTSRAGSQIYARKCSKRPPNPNPRCHQPLNRPTAQVSAHGTGATIPPVDEQVVSLRMVTPGKVRVLTQPSTTTTKPNQTTTKLHHNQSSRTNPNQTTTKPQPQPSTTATKPIQTTTKPHHRTMHNQTTTEHNHTKPNTHHDRPQGTLELSADNDPELFRLARVSLGMLGVVTELTLQAVPLRQLVERTFTATAAEVEQSHVK